MSRESGRLLQHRLSGEHDMADAAATSPDGHLPAPPPRQPVELRLLRMASDNSPLDTTGQHYRLRL
jgi:hypothetical protein